LRLESPIAASTSDWLFSEKVAKSFKDRASTTGAVFSYLKKSLSVTPPATKRAYGEM
jgi:hypothetical protein